MLKRLVSNRFLRVEVRSRQADRIQVTMVDESSSPQTDMGALLVSMGYAVAELKAPLPEAPQLTAPQPKTGAGAGAGAIPKAPGKSAQEREPTVCPCLCYSKSKQIKVISSLLQ